MFIVYTKEEGYIIGRFSTLVNVQNTLAQTPVASEDLNYTDVDDSIELTPLQLNNSKFVNNQIIELTYEEKVNKDKKLNPIVVNKMLLEKNAKLQQENIEMMLAIIGLYEMMSGGSS